MPSAHDPSPIDLGEQLEVSGELGHGAMGVVYRGREKTTGREVALKFLKASLDDVRHQRFRREGHLTAALVHPGIVRVYAAGLYQGRPALSLQLVQGCRTLNEAAEDRDRLLQAERISAAARALGYAHENGIVHRDVKPQNILVDEAGVVRVTDFGIAAATGLERLTITGVLVGTPMYMSPEQIRGDRSAPGPQTDVWALGVVLYEALTGQLPIETGTLIEVLTRIASAEIVPPRALDPTLPESLEAVCLKALERDPELRYSDGTAFANDLDAALAGRSIARSGFAWRPRPRTAIYLVPIPALLLLGWLALSPPAPAPADVTPKSQSPVVSTPSPAPVAASPSPSSPPAKSPADPERWEPLTDVSLPPELDRTYAGQSPSFEILLTNVGNGNVAGALPVAKALLTSGPKGASMVTRDPVAARDWLRWAAERGNGRAALQLAELLTAGAEGLPPDPAEAATWLERHAELGSSYAAYVLGEMKLGGKGIPEDLEGAVALFRRLEESTAAMVQLGLLYQQGRGVPQDDLVALDHFQRAADRGSEWGQMQLGDCYRDGRGVTQDVERAIEIYQEVGGAGEAAGFARIGWIYMEGKLVPRDDGQAARYFRRCLEENPDDLTVRVALGRLLHSGAESIRDPEAARKQLKIGIRAGSGQAMYSFGEMLRDGHGFPAPDPKKAAKFFAQAAENGDPWGWIALGLLYRSGQGVEKDEERALRLFEQAAQEGKLANGWTLYADLSAERGAGKAEVRKLYELALAGGDDLAKQRLAELGE